MIDKSDFEKSCIASALKPPDLRLGDYVSEIGMNRSLADLTPQEVLTIIEIVVTAYQDHSGDRNETT